MHSMFANTVNDAPKYLNSQFLFHKLRIAYF